MSIIKWYEIRCNTCGCAEHFQGSRKHAESQYTSSGGIVSNKKHYCDKNCYRKRKK